MVRPLNGSFLLVDLRIKCLHVSLSNGTGCGTLREQPNGRNKCSPGDGYVVACDKDPRRRSKRSNNLPRAIHSICTDPERAPRRPKRCSWILRSSVERITSRHPSSKRAHAAFLVNSRSFSEHSPNILSDRDRPTGHMRTRKRPVASSGPRSPRQDDRPHPIVRTCASRMIGHQHSSSSCDEDIRAEDRAWDIFFRGLRSPRGGSGSGFGPDGWTRPSFLLKGISFSDRDGPLPGRPSVRSFSEPMHVPPDPPSTDPLPMDNDVIEVGRGGVEEGRVDGRAPLHE